MHSDELSASPEYRYVYLAGPVRSMDDDGKSWREVAGAVLAHFGIVAFDPASAFHRPVRLDNRTKAGMEGVNRTAIAHSQAVIAVVEVSSWNIGTIREIEYARSCDVDVWLVCGEDLQNKVSVFDLHLCSHWSEAIAAMVGCSVDSVINIADEWHVNQEYRCEKQAEFLEDEQDSLPKPVEDDQDLTGKEGCGTLHDESGVPHSGSDQKMAGNEPKRRGLQIARQLGIQR